MDDQIKYAAIDAAVSLEAGEKLLEMPDLSRRLTPEAATAWHAWRYVQRWQPLLDLWRARVLLAWCMEGRSKPMLEQEKVAVSSYSIRCSHRL